MIELDHLPALGLFARVVQSQSFAAAARREGLAKSAVSQRVARLEERLGVRLLRRSTRKLLLTEDGQRLYEHAARLLAVSEEANKCLRGAPDKVTPLCVNAPISTPRARLLAAARDFREIYPTVPVHFTFEDRLNDLFGSPYDVVLRITQLEDHAFVARRLWAGRLAVVGAPHYFAKMGRPDRPEDLLRHRCLHISPRAIDDTWYFFAKGRRVWVPIEPSVESNNLDLLREAALEGQGMMISPALTTADDVAAGRLERVLDAFLPFEIGLFAISPEGKFKRPEARALVAQLARQFAQVPSGVAVDAAPKVRVSSARGRAVRPLKAGKASRAK